VLPAADDRLVMTLQPIRTVPPVDTHHNQACNAA
jgi:hypothetical protein